MPAASLEQILSRQFKAAKRWWVASITAQACLVLIGAALAAFDLAGPVVQVATATALCATAAVRWRADVLLDHADKVLRALERREILGWEVGEKEDRDLRVTAHEDAKAGGPREGSYWDPNASDSFRGRTAKVRESAWWSQHLSDDMFRLIGALAVLLFVVAFVGVCLVAVDPGPPAGKEGAVRFGLALVGLMFTGGFARLSWSYHSFSAAASRIDERAGALPADGGDAPLTKLLWDYQLARTKAPPLPERTWTARQEELNREWTRTSGKE